MILGLLRLDTSDEQVRKACEYLCQFQHGEEEFTTFIEEDAKKEY